MEKIKLSELLSILLDFKQDPSVENKEKINEILAQLQIKPFLDFNTKTICTLKICSNLWIGTKDSIDFAKALIINRALYGLLQYVLNLEVDILLEPNKEALYDLLCEFEVLEYIYKFCHTDFDRLSYLVDKTINFENIQKLVESIQNFDSTGLEELIKTIKETKQSLTPDMLQNLKILADSTSPEFQILKDITSKKVLQNTL